MTTSYQDFAKYVELIRKFPKRKRALTLGDSWFQYPLRSYGDIQRKLATRFGKSLICLDDSYPGRDADEAVAFMPRWERVANYLANDLHRPFNLFLVSLGGNDVIGKDFELHLKNPQDAPDGTTWPWHTDIPDVAKRHLKLNALALTFDIVRDAYLALVDLRDTYAAGATIITHTYADVTPTSKAYEFLGFKTGPWLWKPMRKFGLTLAADQRELSRWLLASFANLLTDVGATTNDFVVLDTRGELSEFTGWWDNEIHPLGKGFEYLVENFWAPAVKAAL